MTKFEKMFLKVAEYSLTDIDYDFEQLTDEEKLIYESQETLDAIRKEIMTVKTWC